MFTIEQLQLIVNLIVAGMKAPGTDVNGIAMGLQAIQWLKEREALLLAKPAPADAVPPPLPSDAPAANGHAEAA